METKYTLQLTPNQAWILMYSLGLATTCVHDKPLEQPVLDLANSIAAQLPQSLDLNPKPDSEDLRAVKVPM
jgi:hypothetical protein